jgi:hypothetical protein
LFGRGFFPRSRENSGILIKVSLHVPEGQIFSHEKALCQINSGVFHVTTDYRSESISRGLGGNGFFKNSPVDPIVLDMEGGNDVCGFSFLKTLLKIIRTKIPKRKNCIL